MADWKRVCGTSAMQTRIQSGVGALGAMTLACGAPGGVKTCELRSASGAELASGELKFETEDGEACWPTRFTLPTGVVKVRARTK